MKRVRQNIETKGLGIDLHMEVSLNGETIIKKRADSIIGNFMRIIYGMATETGDERRCLVKHNTYFRQLNDEITSVNYGSPAQINLANNEHLSIPGSEGLIYLDIDNSGMAGWYYTNQSFNRLELYEVTVDRDAGTITQGNAVDWSAFSDSDWSGNMWISDYLFQHAHQDQRFLTDAEIDLGWNISNKDSEIEDQRLQNPYRRFGTTNTTVSEPAVQTTQSEITLSRTFTNNQNQSITVGEIGLSVHTDLSDERILIARDNVSDFQVSSGASVTIDYVMTLSNSGSGGMMSQFHQLLYRHFADTFRVVRDRQNQDRNDDESGGQFIFGYTGGGNRVQAEANAEFGQFVGPSVGTSTTSVSNTNTSLLSQVPHGYGDDELVYYGSIVEGLTEDKVNDEIYIDISRLFENRGSTTISVAETCLYCGFIDSTDNNRENLVVYGSMIARHVLGSSVDVAPGEALKLTYRFKVIV